MDENPYKPPAECRPASQRRRSLLIDSRAQGLLTLLIVLGPALLGVLIALALGILVR
jgi:hypothetical protein